MLILLPLLRYPRNPIEHNCANDVKRNKGPENPEVPPPFIEVRAKMMQEKICVCKWAVLAALSLLVVNQVPPRGGHKRFHVFAAGSVLWSIEDLELVCSTVHWRPGQRS